MNHMQVFIPNYPPPPFGLEPPNGTSESNQSIFSTQKPNLYKERLQNYQKLRKNPSKPNVSVEKLQKTVKLCEVSKELSHCYGMIKTINAEIEVLCENVSSLTNHQWNDRISQIKSKTNDLTVYTSMYRDANVRNEVKSLVENRLKRRNRIKKRKIETKALKAYETQNRRLKHRKIDQWLEKNVQDIIEQRRQNESKEKAEQILMGVKNRKNEADKILLVLDSLKTLHRIRNRDRSSNVSGDNEFNREIDELKQMWLVASNKYTAEEKGLRQFLGYSNNWDEWRDTIFGEPTKQDTLFSLKKKENGLSQLITIRSLWDKCLVSDDNPFGSSVPIGWVIPNANPSDQWKIYMKNESIQNE